MLRLYGRKIQPQRGTVLIIALLVVAVISGLAISFSGRFQLSMARAEQRLFSSQLQQLLLTNETGAQYALDEDKKEDVKNHGGNLYDHFQEEWSTQVDVYKGFLQSSLDDNIVIDKLSLKDAQSRFNLNLLKSPPSSKPQGSFEERFTVAQQRFIRLLQVVSEGAIDSNQAEQITEAVMDWLDDDDNVTGAGGAESSYYLSLETPYLAANQLFTNSSELRLIKGIDSILYEWLAPLVIALPEGVGINVNTAPVKILRTLNVSSDPEPLSDADGSTLSSTRPPPVEGSEAAAVDEGDQEAKVVSAVTEGFEKIADFVQSNEFEQVFGNDTSLHPSTEQLTTGTEYFIVNMKVDIRSGVNADTADASLEGYSLLRRTQNALSGIIQTQVVSRNSDGVF